VSIRKGEVRKKRKGMKGGKNEEGNKRESEKNDNRIHGEGEERIKRE
jgi:hypothetical protein